MPRRAAYVEDAEDLEIVERRRRLWSKPRQKRVRLVKSTGKPDGGNESNGENPRSEQLSSSIRPLRSDIYGELKLQTLRDKARLANEELLDDGLSYGSTSSESTSSESEIDYDAGVTGSEPGGEDEATRDYRSSIATRYKCYGTSRFDNAFRPSKASSRASKATPTLTSQEGVDRGDFLSDSRLPACSYCNKVFLAQVNLERHLLVTHHNETPYTCKKCYRRFCRLDLLESHCRKLHPESYDKSLLSCPYCGQGPMTLVELLALHQDSTGVCRQQRVGFSNLENDEWCDDLTAGERYKLYEQRAALKIPYQNEQPSRSVSYKDGRPRGRIVDIRNVESYFDRRGISIRGVLSSPASIRSSSMSSGVKMIPESLSSATAAQAAGSNDSISFTTDVDTLRPTLHLDSSSTVPSSVQGDVLNIAAEKFTFILSQHEEIRLVLGRLVSGDENSAGQFPDKILSLLSSFSSRLKKEARAADEIGAAYLIRMCSRNIVYRIQEMLDYNHEPRKLQLKDVDRAVDQKLRLRRYLTEVKPDKMDNDEKGEVKAKLDYESEFDDMEDDQAGYFDDEDYPTFAGVRDFLLASNAFIQLRADFWHLVDPTLETKLMSILKAIGDVEIEVQTGKDEEEWSHEWKRTAEEFTDTSWDWWPLEQRKPDLPAGYKRLLWTCTCGEGQFEDVPAVCAEQITRYGSLQPLNFPSSHPKQTTQDQTIAPITQNAGASQQTTPVPLNSPLGTGSTTQSLEKNLSIVNRQSRSKKVELNTDELFVLLSVPVGENILLEQFRIMDYKDDKFFNQLRTAYIRTKGYWRMYFGIRKFSHCDFYKFEKFDAEEFVALDSNSFPPPENERYRYNPRPVQKMPPIRPHEFNRRFYWCYGRCLPGLFGLPNPFRKCKKGCRLSPDAVNLIPKRTLPLETGGDAREEFWGLYAREAISAMRVVAYIFLILITPLLFWFLWLFYWGHTGDLQNASVPFLCTIGLLGLFFASMYKEKIPADLKQ